MLVRFSTKNFLSFDEEVELSMIHGRARQHPQHIVRDDAWNGIDLLRAAVIYGANASGKSNLIKAMSFAQNLIVKGTSLGQSIPVRHHRFNPSCAERPSSFEFEFKHRGHYYAYGFDLDAQRIHREWLYDITKKTPKGMFERETVGRETTVEFGSALFEDKDKEARQFLKYVMKGTRPNQLFLTEATGKNVRYFEDVFDWFRQVLKIIFPASRLFGLGPHISEEDELGRFLQEYLQLLDTGVSGIALEKADVELKLDNLPQEVRDQLTVGRSVPMSHMADNRQYVLRMNGDQRVQSLKLMTKHRTDDGHEVLLEVDEESDGTQRLMDLIPGLFELLNSERVFVVDELDRSLHPSLSYKLLEHFLNNPGQESQFIVTTHESSLLDLDLLRRDEIWFIEKNRAGASSVYSLEEFTPRYDKDIRKGYLVGRFGAIPVIGNISHLGWAKREP